MSNMFRRAWHYFLVVTGQTRREGVTPSDPAERQREAQRAGQREEEEIIEGTDAGWPESEGPAPRRAE